MSVFLTAALVVLVVVGGQVSDSSTITLTGTVDANWRGAYDLLVRPQGSRISAAATAGLIEPNFLTFTGEGGISEAQLDAIRSMSSVEVAAPVSVVGYVRYSFSAPSMFTSRLPAAPTMYRLNLAVTTSDGIRDHLVQNSTIRLLLGPADLTKPTVPFASDAREMAYAADGLSIAFPELPGIVSPLIAVDPAAERELLGPSGSFLDSFSRLSPPRSALTVAQFDQSLIPKDLDGARFFINLLAHQSSEAGRRPIVPIVISNHLYAPLQLILTIDQIGHPLAKYPTAAAQQDRLAQAEQAAGSGLSAVGTTSLDLSSFLRPFDSPSMTVLWPGSSPPDGTELATRVDDQFVARLGERPTYVPNPGTTPGFRIVPVGTVDPSGVEPSGPGPRGTTRGTEQAYRNFVPVPFSVASGFEAQNPFDRPFVFAPIGEFDLSSIEIPKSSVSYVPYGAYDPPATSLTVGDTQVSMSPTLNAAGFIEVPPLAITDMAAARLLRGPGAIDAIRVRVAGLTTYTPEARNRVQQVATAIAALGLDVDIVAGSSPQDVQIFVPAYDTSVQPPADLGFVRQPWTTLGAAQQVVRALSTVDQALFALLVAVAGLLTVTAEGMSRAVRRREISILKSLGWTHTRLVRWYGSEILILSAVTLPVVWWATDFGARLAGLVAGMVVISLAAGIRSMSVVIAYRQAGGQGAFTENPGSLASRLRVRGAATLALRTIVGRAPRTASAILAMAVGCGGLGVASSLVVEAVRAAGPTRLAERLTADLHPYQLMLLLTLGVISIGLMLLLGRLDLSDRASEIRALAASGWSARRITGSLSAQFSVWVVGGGFGGTAIAAWIATATDTAVAEAGAAAVAVALIASIPLLALARDAGYRWAPANIR